MNKPVLIVVTGSIASGKTTLSHVLAKKVKCPLLSRDECKEGLLNTLNIPHTQADNTVDWQVSDAFFEAIDLFTSKGISIIVEAAFQDKLWRPKLLNLLNKAELRIIICQANLSLLKSRFDNRFANDPDREKFHGDKSLRLSDKQFGLLTENYKPVDINAPTLHVDTTDNYNPGVEEIIRFIRQ